MQERDGSVEEHKCRIEAQCAVRAARAVRRSWGGGVGRRMAAVGVRARAVACALVCAALVMGARAGPGARRTGSRYAFYRSMGGAVVGGDTRRVFGGAAAELSEFPAACALLDRYWGARCSGAVLAPRWALTAAHCVSPRLAYVKYNTRHPAGPTGDVGVVLYLYRHPKYKVVQEDEGRGMDVTLLHHDVGLVRTRADMALSALAARAGPPPGALATLRLYSPVDLHGHDVKVMGFGRTESGAMGEELFAVRLRMVFCERGAWFHCVCGVAAAEAGGGAAPARGVCSGDSGGPVIYNGAQVGVTSMGPMECATLSGGGVPAPAGGATSVFTALYNYADLINATMHDMDAALRMRLVPSAAPVAPSALAPFILLYCVLSSLWR